MNRNVRVIRARCDGKWMPLLLGDGWDLDKEPLTGLVSERWLLELDFESIEWVTNNLDNAGGTASANLTVNTFKCVEDTSPYIPSPGLITNAVFKEQTSSEWRVGFQRTTDEASSGMSVESQKEWNEKMVGVPKRFK